MNPLVPDAWELTLDVVAGRNALLAMWSLATVLRERKPLPWLAFEVLAIALVPVADPGTALRHRAGGAGSPSSRPVAWRP